MADTVIVPPPAMQTRLASRHNGSLNLNPAKKWDIPALARAGALRSSANDMLTFLAAYLGYTDSLLGDAMAAMLRTRRPGPPVGDGSAKIEVALGWMITTRSDSEIVWHSGGTLGHRSILALDRKRRAGIVVLSNAGTAAGVDDIGMHLLDSSVPLTGPVKEHIQISVDTRASGAFVGRYQVTPSLVLAVTCDADHLFVQATGQPRFEIFPESPRQYFLKVVEAVITFADDVDGHAPSLILHQNGRDVTATRIE